MKPMIAAYVSLLVLSPVWGETNYGAYMSARHDFSACYSSLSDQFSHIHNNAVRSKVTNWYQRRLESMVGVYESEQSERLNYFEWAGCAKLLIYVQDTNHISLIVEGSDHLLYQANDSCGGILTDKTLFFGPSQAGLCFYYETVGDTLFTIFSPFGLQEKIVFRRTNKLINRIPSEVYKPIFERTRMGGSFTNWEYYIDCSTNREQVRRCELKRMERLESIRGTYVYKNQKERGCKLWSNADEVYLIINNTNDVVLAELVRNKLYFVEESRPACIDDRMIKFGIPMPYIALYTMKSNTLSAIFVPWITPPLVNVDVTEIYKSAVEFGMFQKSMDFVMTSQLPECELPKSCYMPQSMRIEERDKRFLRLDVEKGRGDRGRLICTNEDGVAKGINRTGKEGVSGQTDKGKRME